MTAAISCEGLRKAYGKTVALSGLTFAAEGGCVGFVGPNGSGKTTTLRILAGLARPQAGEAAIGGHDIARTRRDAQRLLGYLPQAPAFPGNMTALEYVRWAAVLQGVRGTAAARGATLALERLGLGDAAQRRVAGFSGGMKQRLGIAAAIVHRPPVLLLDEPMSALDPLGRREMIELILELKREATVLVSSHVLEDVERSADQVVIVRQGETVLSESMEALRARYLEPMFEFDVLPSDPDLLSALRSQPWVRSAERASDTYRVVARDVATARAILPGEILGLGATLLRYGMRAPTLEDVFLRVMSQ
jgi:ABC-2 type transport system ATP-binding protein